MPMIEALLYKKLFLYLIPFNFLVGEFGAGAQYRFNYEWAADLHAGYTADIEGTFTGNIYEGIFKSGNFYYSGPFVKVSVLSVIPRGPNPLRTDYNQLEVAYRYLSYDNLDFTDQDDPDKVFNLSEDMQAISLSWKAGYNIIPRDVFELNGFIGFGLQVRMKTTYVNSYGYFYQSDQFPVGDITRSTQLVPLFHAGIKIGYKTLENIPAD